jgi:hypothetical protein
VIFPDPVSLFQPVYAPVDEITKHADHDNDAKHNQTDGQSQAHSAPRDGVGSHSSLVPVTPDPITFQKAFPRKGSMRPKYMTPTHSAIADAAIALTLGGALSPGPTSQGPSKAVK